MVAGRRLNSQGPPGAGPAAGAGGIATLRALPEVFQYTRHALQLVWSTSRPLTIALALLTLVAGVLPAAIAYVGALIVDAVVAAIAVHGASGVVDLSTVLGYVALEGLLVAAMAATQRGLSTCQSLLRAQLGQRVNEMILEKALTLELRHFEDSEFYDKLTRARREASTSAAVAGHAQLRAGAERHRARELRHAAVAVLALGGAGAAGRRPAVVRRRGEILRRCVPAVPLALARDAHADVPRDGARARGPRQGSEAVRPRAAAARPLSGDLPQGVQGGPRAHHPPRHLGLLPRPDQHRGVLRGVRVDRGQRRARRRSRSAR